MSSQIAFHFILMLAWVLLSDDFSLKNLVVGYLVGGVVLWFFERSRGEGLYVWRVVAAIKLVLVLLWEQVKSTFQVAAIVLSPRISIRPGVVTVPLEVTGDAEITTVANMISLTPGTLTIDVSEDRKSLYVHVIDLDDPKSVPGGLMATKRRFEALVLGVSGR